MTFSKQKFIHNVNVYYFDNTFYAIGLVRMPPIGMRTEILPLYTSSNNSDYLAQAIQSAKLCSNFQNSFNENTNKQRWVVDKDKVRDNSKKLWEIFWEEDGSVSINLSIPDKKYKGGMMWKSVPNSERIFSPPVSSRDIAQAILSQP